MGILSALLSPAPATSTAPTPTQGTGILSKLLGGVNQFSDQLVNPTTGLGRLGAYLGAAAGAPLGEAALASMKDARTEQEQGLEKQLKMAQISKALQPEKADPHFFQTNDGSEGAIDPSTGQVKILYQDPTPKVTWINADNGDGTKTLVPTIGGIPMSGAQGGSLQTSGSPPLKPVGKLTPLSGGGASNGAGTFR